MSKPILSTHVLDTSTGRPATGISVELFRKEDAKWTVLHNSTTNSDGRVPFPITKASMTEGTYKLVFQVGDYYKSLEKETFYPKVEIIFKTKEGKHYHVPLLLSPYGYSTYRGS